jgi:hypothetical protein
MGYTISVSGALIIQRIYFLSCLPMDKNSTPITEQVISKALKKEKFPSPSASSLEFIKNFARNFRVEKSLNGDFREFVLN